MRKDVYLWKCIVLNAVTQTVTVQMYHAVRADTYGMSVRMNRSKKQATTLMKQKLKMRK